MHNYSTSRSRMTAEERQYCIGFSWLVHAESLQAIYYYYYYYISAFLLSLHSLYYYYYF